MLEPVVQGINKYVENVWMFSKSKTIMHLITSHKSAVASTWLFFQILSISVWFHSQKNIPGSRMPISCSWASLIRRPVPNTLGSNAAYPERNFTVGVWFWQRALPDSSFLLFLEESGNNRIFVKFSSGFWKDFQSGDGGKKGGHKQEVVCDIGLYSCSQ